MRPIGVESKKRVRAPSTESSKLRKIRRDALMLPHSLLHLAILNREERSAYTILVRKKLIRT